MSTSFQTTEEARANRKWTVVDAEGQVVGRLATQIADTLRGKNKPTFAPHLDVGDFVVVVNAEKVKFTGRKTEQKEYKHHTGFIGGLKSIKASTMFERKPEEVLRKAVRGMLPKTPLGRRQLKKLKIYSGPDHPHAAQQPEPLSS